MTREYLFGDATLLSTIFIIYLTVFYFFVELTLNNYYIFAHTYFRMCEGRLIQTTNILALQLPINHTYESRAPYSIITSSSISILGFFFRL